MPERKHRSWIERMTDPTRAAEAMVANAEAQAAIELLPYQVAQQKAATLQAIAIGFKDGDVKDMADQAAISLIKDLFPNLS